MVASIMAILLTRETKPKVTSAVEPQWLAMPIIAAMLAKQHKTIIERRRRCKVIFGVKKILMRIFIRS